MATLWLIVEDQEDAKIIQALIEVKGIQLTLKVLPPALNAGGIYRLAQVLEQRIKTAIAEKAPHDCIAVLHDADEHTQPDRDVYERIEKICQNYKQHVKLVLARNSIEAWLLADSGIARWLGIKAESHDSEANPKQTLEGQLRKKKLKWQGGDRAKVLAQLAGDGDQHSVSMKTAAQYLVDAPCTQNQ